MFALPAVELFENCTKPKVSSMYALPAVELPEKDIPEKESSLEMVALPAVELFENCVKPPLRLVIICVAPELFVMPVPLMVSVKLGLTEMVYAEAAGLNVMPLTSVFAEIETLVVFERSNVAVSA